MYPHVKQFETRQLEIERELQRTLELREEQTRRRGRPRPRRRTLALSRRRGVSPPLVGMEASLEATD